MDPEKAPHVRMLNPIPLRTLEEQELKNKESKYIHQLANASHPKRERISEELIVANGGEVIEVIKRLLKEKDEALKSGDPEKARKLRIQLRKLHYKRYLKKGEEG